MATPLIPERTDNFALLECRPTTLNALGMTKVYARHVFLSAELGAACKCGRYHILGWQDGTPRTDFSNREGEIIVIGGAR